ncbi:MAG TPA: hypothetical protein VFF03_04685 [Rhodocyclaceae bacterium]|nr:hypothetical protein [Rhodocyclaceae bacterium]
MNTHLCIGIASRNDALEMAARESGRPVILLSFPATGMGVEAIKVFLADYDGQTVRLAVTGTAAVSLALALGNVPGRETFVVSPDIADQPAALARYAERAV